VALDRGLELAFADQPGVVMKFRLDQMEQVSPAVDALSKAGGGGRLLDTLTALSQGDIFALTGPMLGQRIDTPASLDKSKATYISLTSIGGDRYADAFLYGAPLQPPAALPEAVSMRWVIPANDPAALEEALDSTADAAKKKGRTLVTRVEGDYVVADYLAFLGGATALADDASKAAAPRKTPAFELFADAQDPLSVYINTRDLLVYGAARNRHDMDRALETASPDFRARMLAAGVAGNLNSPLISPSSEREIEDTFLSISGDGAKLMTFSGHSTLTDLGRSLAKINEQAFVVERALHRDADTLVDVRANLALDAMADAAPVEYATGDTDPTTLGRNVSRMLRETGFVGYAALFFGSPTLMLRIGAQAEPSGIWTLLPRALHAGVLAEKSADETEEDQASAPFPGFGLTLQYGDLDGEKTAELQKRLAALAPGRTLDVDTGDNDGGPILRAATDDHLAGDASTVELDGGRLWFSAELARLMEVMKADDPADALGPFAQLDGEISYHEATMHWDLLLGEYDMQIEKVPEMNVEPQAVAPGCVGEVLQSRLPVFQGMARMGSDASAEDFEDLLAEFDNASSACADANPEHADALALGRARFGYFIARWGEMLGKPEIVEAMHQRGCDLGDQLQCDMLE
ncbi:MAG: hypothetical protein ACQEVA_21985, partial [Myxococcota bacterium]